MKINLDEHSYYEITIPQQCDGESLGDIIQRLSDIYKFVKLSPIKLTPKIEKEKFDTSWRSDRDTVVRVIKTHYHGTPEEKEELSKEIKTDWVNAVGAVWALRKRHNVQPNEVGMLRWPKQGE